MYITFEDDKSVDQEEVKPTSEGARSERQDRPEWRYVETPSSEMVVAGGIELRAHWRGTQTLEQVRGVLRMASAAPALYESAQAALRYIEDENPGAAAGDAWVAGICDRLRAAISLVDGNKETK